MKLAILRQLLKWQDINLIFWEKSDFYTLEYSEEYLEPSRKFMMEFFFAKIVDDFQPLMFLQINPKIHVWVLNTLWKW